MNKELVKRSLTASEMGKIGGSSRSNAKIAAGRINAKKATAALKAKREAIKQGKKAKR